MHHFRKTHRSYAKLKSTDKRKGGCPFCTDKSIITRTVSENSSVRVVKNRTKYDIFEGRRVIGHLMIIPKRHVESLAELHAREWQDMATVIGEYESRGYNVFARGSTSVSRSVRHQHTHLIKLEEKPVSFFVFIKTPYILWQKRLR